VGLAVSPMSAFANRHAISRAVFFLALADRCTAPDRDAFEAFLEAAIVFGRTAIHRLLSQFEAHPEWKGWFASLRGNPSVEFFRQHRDFILKEGPPKVGQIIGFNPDITAAQMYYFDTPDIPATETVRRHLAALAELVRDAEIRFSNAASR